MKQLILTLVPVVASLVAAAAIQNSKGIQKPHNQSGVMPTGESRCGDQDSLDGTLSFWQLEPHRINYYQL